MTTLFFDRFLAGVQLRLQCGQLLGPLADFLLPLPPLRFPLIRLRQRCGVPGHGEVAMVGRAERDDFQLDAADAEAVAGTEPGVSERLAIQARVGRPAANDRRVFAAENEAMERSDAGGAEPQRATRSGADAALPRADADELAVAVGPADAENQLADGGVRQGRSRSADHFSISRGMDGETGGLSKVDSWASLASRQCGGTRPAGRRQFHRRSNGVADRPLG